MLALHVRHVRPTRARRCSATARCWPTSSRRPRPSPAPITSDDIVLGRAAAVPRLRPQRRARPGAAPGRDARPRASGSCPTRRCELVAAEQVTVVPVAPPVITAWSTRDDVADKLASVRTLLSGAAPMDEALVRAFEARTGVAGRAGLRPDRGGTDRHVDARHAGAQAGLDRPRAAGCRAAARRRRSGTTSPPTTRARSWSAAPTCSAATGPTATRPPTPTAGWRPATSASSTATATCSWSTGSRSWSSSTASTSTRRRSRTSSPRSRESPSAP